MTDNTRPNIEDVVRTATSLGDQPSGLHPTIEDIVRMATSLTFNPKPKDNQ